MHIALNNRSVAASAVPAAVPRDDVSLNTGTGLGKHQFLSPAQTTEQFREAGDSEHSSAVSRISAFTRTALLYGTVSAGFVGLALDSFLRVKHPISGLIEVAMAAYSAYCAYKTK